MKYEGFKPTEKVIEWFWEILKEWDNSQRKRFLAAITGKFYEYYFEVN